MDRKVANRVIGEVITHVYVLFGNKAGMMLGVYRTPAAAEEAARTMFILPSDHYSIMTYKLDG